MLSTFDETDWIERIVYDRSYCLLFRKQTAWFVFVCFMRSTDTLKINKPQFHHIIFVPAKLVLVAALVLPNSSKCQRIILYKLFEIIS